MARPLCHANCDVAPLSAGVASPNRDAGRGGGRRAGRLTRPRIVSDAAEAMPSPRIQGDIVTVASWCKRYPHRLRTWIGDGYHELEKIVPVEL